MKATAQSITAPARTDKSRAALLADLFKARLTLLVLLTTLVGFYIGVRGPVDYLLMFHTLFGTALLASGAAALNQLWERTYDARMRRTQDRPLPSGRMEPGLVLRIGLGCSLSGVIYLAGLVNVVTAALGLASLILYLFVYTPLKRVTWFNTWVGAIPGGLPPLMGWTAARGGIGIEGIALFAILGLWQIPHFMAIAWMYRDEYARAGFKMLPAVDPEGLRTSRQSVAFTALLIPISIAPFLLHLAGWGYLVGASVLSILFFYYAVQFARHLTEATARRLFYFSIIYLPVLLTVMVLDKLK